MLKMEEIKKFIKPLQLAHLMGVPPTTVYSWDIIPKWREDAVLKVLKKNKIQVSRKDFYKGE